MIKTPFTKAISKRALASGEVSADSAVLKSALSLGSSILLATNFMLSGLGVASAYMVTKFSGFIDDIVRANLHNKQAVFVLV
jgi:4-hydroxybenzoate polyprenyltransferase